MRRQELVDYCQQFLHADQFKDYCPNGLQVEGRDHVKTLISGVSASQALVTAAIKAKADLILVHHGYFWKGDDPCINGMLKKRLHLLLTHDINLLVYHLPLDAHAELGNNAQLGQLLNGQNIRLLNAPDTPSIIFQADLATAKTPAALQDFLSHTLHRAATHLDGGPERITRIAWCTGAAQDFIHHAAAAGCDAFISGEVSERTFHQAQELGIHYYAIGHHASERYGVQALGEHLAQHFDLQHQFIDIDNPI